MANIKLTIENPIHFKVDPQKHIKQVQDEVNSPRIQNQWDTYSNRIGAYGSFVQQLDQIWHDIDTGKILADTDSPGTWYHTIKQIKLAFPKSTDPSEFTSNTEILTS